MEEKEKTAREDRVEGAYLHTDRDMESEIWEEIDRSESYLVCSMYEEASSLASSIIKRLDADKSILKSNEADGILVSVGMVFIQSLKGMGRGADILKELKILFATTAIPVQLLLTGVCFQISERSFFYVRDSFQDFFSKWVYVDQGYYVLSDDVGEDSSAFCQLDIDTYMQVVELYAVTYLGIALEDVDGAVTWVEKAAIPEERRQGILRKLHSLCSVREADSVQASSVQANLDPNAAEGSSGAFKTKYMLTRDSDRQQATLHSSPHERQSFGWSRNFIIKFGKAWSIVANGKVLLSLFMFLLYIVFRRKRAAFMRMVRRQVLMMKKGAVDLWQLVFSYQVSPLASVQPLLGATRSS